MNSESKTVFSENFQSLNRAFLLGDAVKVSFYVKNREIILAEECYFFLMASMRKMRMAIPLSYTLDFFQNMFIKEVLNLEISNAVISFLVYRNFDEKTLEKAGISYFFEIKETENVLKIRKSIELDLIKEISVNTNLLSNIYVHCPENIYAEIYAKENALDDVILLNPNKRIARSIFGNLLFLEENIIKIPKQSEGAYISPLLESFVTFVAKNKLAEIQEVEMIAFESQKADEILSISEERGIFSVQKIRNKTFPQIRLPQMVDQWEKSFA